VAERQVDASGQDVLYYLAGDHLGTTSVALDSSGNKVAESRHRPYGVERWSSGTLPTDYRFTGQLFQESLGIYQMGVRFYDPSLARWLSADTRVPEPGNPQALNRYSYVLGNPLLFIDPSGHRQVCNRTGTICADDGTVEPHSVKPPQPPPPEPIQLPGKLTVQSLEDLQKEPEAMLVTRVVFGEARGGPPERWRWVAATIVVRAASNYGGFGFSIHAQVLHPYQYSVFDHVTTGTNPGENHMKTLDPCLERGGEKRFGEIYRVVAPMVEAALQGNYSRLPLEFRGPDAYDSFRVQASGDVRRVERGEGIIRWSHFWYQGHNERTWPWRSIGIPGAN